MNAVQLVEKDQVGARQNPEVGTSAGSARKRAPRTGDDELNSVDGIIRGQTGGVGEQLPDPIADAVTFDRTMAFQSGEQPERGGFGQPGCARQFADTAAGQIQLSDRLQQVDRLVHRRAMPVVSHHRLTSRAAFFAESGVPHVGTPRFAKRGGERL